MKQFVRPKTANGCNKRNYENRLHSTLLKFSFIQLRALYFISASVAGYRHVHELLHGVRLLQPDRVRHRERDDGRHQRHRAARQGTLLPPQTLLQEHRQAGAQQAGQEDHHLHQQGVSGHDVLMCEGDRDTFII